MKIAILGYGREGQSALKFLKKSGVLRGDEIWILDRNQKIKIPKGVQSKLGARFLKNISEFDVVLRSPGIPYNLPELQRARKAEVLFSSATKLFFANCPARIIGVTGTKGKGTTSTILYNILKGAGKDVFLVGNIGTPALDVLPKLKKTSLVVMELSSFQLQDLETSPHIAVITEMFPDHQDSHKNLAEYYGAKENIARYQKKSDKIYYLERNKIGKRTASYGKGKKIAVDEKKFRLFSLWDLKIKGEHNFKNAFMAAVVAKNLGVPAQKIVQAAKKFRGNEHRLEFVRKINGVEFYNDSASTNPNTAVAAVRAFRGVPSILIAGGRDKHLNYNYTPLAKSLKNSGTKLAILMGENNNKIAKTIKKESGKWIAASGKIKLVKNLEEAVKASYDHALHSTLHAPYVVLFSPGAKSFDMFKNYEERGTAFKKIVERLL